MVMIVLGLISLTYYTTVFCVYGKLALGHSNKAGIATAVIVIYNLLVRPSHAAHRPAVGRGLLERGPRMHRPRVADAPRAAPARRRAGVHAVVELFCRRAHGAGARAAGLAAQRGGRGGACVRARTARPPPTALPPCRTRARAHMPLCMRSRAGDSALTRRPPPLARVRCRRRAGRTTACVRRTRSRGAAFAASARRGSRTERTTAPCAGDAS